MHLDRCKQLLLYTRRTVKTQLSRLTLLDRQLEKVVHQYDALALTIITLLREQNSSQTTEKREQLMQMSQQLQKIQDQMDRLGEQKLRLSNSLYCSVSGSCEEVDEYLLSQEPPITPKTLGMQEGPELSNLLQECRIDQALHYCHCSNQTKTLALERGETMVLCEGSECTARWYHIGCVGMSQQSIPNTAWFCPRCCKKD